MSRKTPAAKAVSAVAEQITAPVAGTLVPLAEVDDKVFQQGLLDPAAILPDEGRIYSPVDGVIASTFASGHAIGIRSTAGAEILIHVGINTVQLDGQYFDMQVKEGDEVKKGQLLLIFDRDEIKQAGYDIVTPVIITNSETRDELQISDRTHILSGDAVMSLSR